MVTSSPHYYAPEEVKIGGHYTCRAAAFTPMPYPPTITTSERGECFVTEDRRLFFYNGYSQTCDPARFADFLPANTETEIMHALDALPETMQQVYRGLRSCSRYTLAMKNSDRVLEVEGEGFGLFLKLREIAPNKARRWKHTSLSAFEMIEWLTHFTLVETRQD